MPKKGLFNEALAELEHVKVRDRQTAVYLTLSGYTHALMGNTAEALRYVEKLESSQASDAPQVGPGDYEAASRQNLNVARIYVGLGDYEAAFRRLAATSVWRVPHINLNAYPWMAPLRDDPRFKAKLRRLGLEP